MHVAISAAFWGQTNTGSGQYLHRLVSAFQQQHPDVHVTLLLPTHAARESLPDGIDHRLIPTPLDGRNANLAKVWFEQVGVPRAARDLNADVLHVPYFAPPLRSSVPVVATIHDLIPMILPAYRGSRLVKGYTSLVAQAARRTPMILADSEASRQDILRLLRVPDARVRTVYLAADDTYTPQSAGRVAEIRNRYHLPDQFVLYLGGFDVRKNVPALIEAAAQSKGNWRLVIAGKLPKVDSDFFPHPEPRVKQKNLAHRVQFTGWIDEADKPALLSAASVFAFPTLYEGFGLPILEAMACGTATVTTNVSSCPELAGDAARLVPPNDTGALREALDALMADDARRWALAGRGPAQAATFSWERCAAETKESYVALL